MGRRRCTVNHPLLLRAIAYPDRITYNAAISTCSKGEQWQLALVLLQTMVNEDIVADNFSYNSAVSACSECTQWQRVFYILQRMPVDNVLPDAITQAPQKRKLQQVWLMASHGFRLVVWQPVRMKHPLPRFNGAISACSRVGRWQMSIYLLDSMPARRTPTSKFSFGSAIDACGCDSFLWDKALMLLKKASQVGG